MVVHNPYLKSKKLNGATTPMPKPVSKPIAMTTPSPIPPKRTTEHVVAKPKPSTPSVVGRSPPATKSSPPAAKRPTAVVTPVSRTKTKFSLKLKQEIANLKKGRQLQKMQQEAQERRRQKERLQEQKAAEREKFLQERQEQRELEQKRRLEEKNRKLEEKARRVQEAQRQAEERVRLAQEKQVQQREQAEKEYQLAVEDYHKKAADYRVQYAVWLQRQQQLQLQYIQQWQWMQWGQMGQMAYGQPNSGFNRSVTPYMPIPSQVSLPAPIPPVPPKKPRCLLPKPAPKPQPPAKLCQVMQPPSPFADTHVMLEQVVTLVRSGNGEQPSFGVSLYVQSTTILVQPTVIEPKPIQNPTPSVVTTSAIEQQRTKEVSLPTVPEAAGLPSEPKLSETTMPLDPAIKDSVPCSQAKNVTETSVEVPLGEKASTSEVEATSKVETSTTVSVSPPGENSTADATPDTQQSIPLDTKTASTTPPVKEPSTTSSPGTKETPSVVESTTAPMTMDASDARPPVVASASDATKVPKMVPAVPSNPDFPAQNSKASTEQPIPVTSSDAIASTNEQKVKPAQIQQPNTRRQRRRRVQFSVLAISDAEKQNERWKDRKNPDGSNPILLQKDDVVVSVGDVSLHGMTFVEACQTFSKQAVLQNGEYSVRLRIARRKPRVVLPRPIPVALPKLTEGTAAASKSNLLGTKVVQTRPQNTSLNFNLSEMAVLADCVLQAIHTPSNRLLGETLSPETFRNSTAIFRMVATLPDCIIGHRTVETLQSKWSAWTQTMTIRLAERSRESWNDAWQKEGGSASSTVAFSSDAQRTALRQLPRPTKGCRCESMEHEYLHDVRCLLYRDIASVLPKSELQQLQYDPKQGNTRDQRKDSSSKSLNAVESAVKDRFLKQRAMNQFERDEARFVARMEEVQVTQLNKAIQAPNLTSMVMSAILELQREFPTGRVDQQMDDDSDDENEQELTLSTLATKSENPDVQEDDTRKTKKAKNEPTRNLNFRYLMKMVQYIGKTWGHVYREPAHEDYAWRWELFHGHHSEDAKWEAQARNPRQPDSMPFEHIRFGLRSRDVKADCKLAEGSKSIAQFEDYVLSELSCAETATNATTNATATTTTNSTETSSPKTALTSELKVEESVVEQLGLAAYWLSPSSSGLYDELLALCTMGIVEMTPSGLPVLTPDWATKVDVVLLDDMHETWGTEADPDRMCCINLELRDTLESEWVKTSRGWSMADDRYDVVFDSQVLDDWRTSFQGNIEGQVNMSEGIGRFGL